MLRNLLETLFEKPAILLVPVVLLILLHSLPALGAMPTFTSSSQDGVVASIGVEGGVLIHKNVKLIVPPGPLTKPLKIRLQELDPDTPPPGPVPEGVTIVRAVRISIENQPYGSKGDELYWRNFLFGDGTLSISLEGAPGRVADDSDYFTDVCVWAPEDNIAPPELPWLCGIDWTFVGDATRPGAGRIDAKAYGVKQETGDVLYYVFQYPKAQARANCEAAGGVFKADSYTSWGEFTCKDVPIEEKDRYTFVLGKVVLRKPLSVNNKDAP